MRLSKDHADYQYAPPPERTRRVAKLLKIMFQVFTGVGCLLMALRAINLM